MLLSSQVCIPMMILPLLCAAYAEVNGEGKRLLKVIVNLLVITRENSSYLSVWCYIYFSVSAQWSRDYMHFTSCGSLHLKWLFLVPCHFFFISNFIRYLLSFKITLVFRIFQGMNITYGAMGTAAAGLLLALTSRVVLKQLGAGSS